LFSDTGIVLWCWYCSLILVLSSLENNTSIRGQYQYQWTIPVSEDNTSIREQYQYQRTIPVSEDNTGIRG
jgi:hypothetical protein